MDRRHRIIIKNLVAENMPFKTNAVIEESTGFFGFSGGGKSTLLQAIVSGTNIITGSVHADEVDTSKISDSERRLLFAVYPQDISIVNGTLLDNICLERNPINKNEIEEYFTKAFVILNARRVGQKINSSKDVDFINQLDRFLRYKEEVGENVECNSEKDCVYYGRRYIEETYVLIDEIEDMIQTVGLTNLCMRKDLTSSSISGGEKQRIGLARVLLNKNAHYYFLDEPFTSLDSIAEAELIGVLKRQLKSKTIIVISHNLSIIKRLCTKIMFFDGKECLYGRHEDLIKNGKYSELYSGFVISGARIM